MLYIEHQPRKRSILLLFLLGIAVYLISLCLFEIRSVDEGLCAAVVRDMQSSGDYIKTRLYGRAIREFPLYSWLVALFSLGGEPTVWSLRLPSLLVLVGMAVVGGWQARRLQSGFAGYVAASVIMLSLVSFHVGVRAQAGLLQAFLTGSSWCLWYYFGVDKRKWNLAWASSLALVFLGVLNTGLMAVFWFYFPLIFMPRQVNSRGRMLMPVHIVCVLLLAVLVIGWLWITPDQPLLPWSREAGLSDNPRHGNYLWHLVVFPWKMCYYLMPWSLLLWAPFCEALRQFENTPVACRYYRIVIIVMFLCVWLCAGSSPLDLLPLLMPVGMLIGVHFEIVLRRHQRILRGFVHGMGWLTVALSILVSAGWACVVSGWVRIDGIGAVQSWSFAILPIVMALLLFIVFLRPSSKCTFRSSFVWCICGVRVLMLATGDSYMNWVRSDIRWRGEVLAGAAAFDAAHLGLESVEAPAEADGWGKVKAGVRHVYYKPEKGAEYIHLGEFGVLGRPLVFVNPKRDLGKVFSDSEKRVYVLSRYMPAVANRTWRALGKPMDMGLERIYKAQVLQGEKPWLVISREPRRRGGRAGAVMQLFEGTLEEPVAER